MWLIINRAVDDFNIRETILFQTGQAPHIPEAELVRERISQEALHGALRISALVRPLSFSLSPSPPPFLFPSLASLLTTLFPLLPSQASVLTTNGYLRLDPNFLQFSLFEAGLLLAKLGRPEVEPCVAGLRQYGMSFEECYDQADLIIRIYDEARKRSAAAHGFEARGAILSRPPMGAGSELGLPRRVSGDVKMENGHHLQVSWAFDWLRRLLSPASTFR